jgi:hypothetical protein
MSPVLQISFIDVLCYLGTLWIVTKLCTAGAIQWCGWVQTTPLWGPASKSFWFGLCWHIITSDDPAALYEEWSTQYGPAFKIPRIFRASKTMICDPKANTHFYAKETFG